MNEYLCVARDILDNGIWVENKRTGTRCKTLIGVDMVYSRDFPLVTTRKINYKGAIAELLGYLRGYSNAQQFADLGAPTWFANANENKDWLNNSNRTGEDDMGRVYGVQGRAWRTPVVLGTNPIRLKNIKYTDQLKKVVDNLSAGIDDRGEILTFWNPGEFDLGCLRPCMHTHTFSLLDGVLYLTSYQRSADTPLGLTFNSVQCYVLLALMAQITGLKPGKAYHKIVNAHIYEDQIELMKEQIKRVPFEPPTLTINPDIKTLEDVETWVTVDDFVVDNYQHHPAINYPFTV